MIAVNNIKYYKGLDVLRAFAVFFVIITHWGPHQFSSVTFTAIYQKILPDGNFGVDLFFVLSGFLITKILLNANLESNGINKMKIIKSFYIRRSLRIFPVYYILILIVFLLGDQGVRNHLPYYLTYTSNIFIFQTNIWDSISHTWSLAVEEQFYIIWPWVIILCPQNKILKTILAFLAVGIISSLAIHYFYGAIFYVLTPTCFTAFSIGALASYLQIYPNVKIQRIITFALPFAILFFMISQFGHKLVLIRLINSIIAVNLILYVTKEKYNTVTKFIFENRLLITIGKISYGIYLYHFITPRYYLEFIDYINHYSNFSPRTLRILTYPPPAYLIQLAIVFFVSYISFKYLESSFTKLKRYFSYTDSNNITKHIENINIKY
ncbi:acyltransferase [Pedobacter changchengzhani]|uniref:Acyltransferase n=1 Tax=Pedobacter changchengzhani TaxID=2529274 RepID=A0A4R5MIT5_9SPHI|nr:acyltransferase [Pedobacter changchengzhani]TDG35296.1 acyltransferase [Pedobacter changchengzhani]